MKTEYIITYMVRDDDGLEDEYYTIASGFSDLQKAIKFAEQTDGTVEIVAQYTYEDGTISSKGENYEYEHVGFVDGEQHYHDKG